MGMDVEHYVINQTFDNTDLIDFNYVGIPCIVDGRDTFSIRIFELSSPKMKEWALNNGFHIHTTKVFDLDKWYDDHYHDTECQIFDIDVGIGTVDKFIYMFDPETNIYDYVYTGFDGYYKDHEFIIADTRKRGYMRKPFGHSYTETKTTTIYLTNFSDAGISASDIMREYDQEMLENCWVKIVDVNVLKKLAECSYDPIYFRKVFVDNFTSTSIIDFNW